MDKDELGFADIQKIFAARDREKNNKNGEQEINQPKTKVNTSLKYEQKPLRSNPQYKHMHAKNIKITKKGKQKANVPLLLLTGITVVGMAIGIGHYMSNKQVELPETPPGIVYMEEKESNEIDASQCDLSNFTIVLREATPNVGAIVNTTEKELENFGVDFITISADEDVSNVVSDLKSDNPGKDIIVINVDGYVNKTDVESVVMTNYSNDVKSADVLALAMQQSSAYGYNLSSDIRCGKKDGALGERTKTSVEAKLYEDGHTDVACLTIAPNPNVLADEVSCNNMSTVIAESVIRFAALEQDKRYSDLVRRIEVGDTISQLAVDNDVSETYIRTINHPVLSETNGNLLYNTAIIVRHVPSVLTTQYSVKNSIITSDPMDITTEIGYYTVQPNDTLSEIADNLNVNQSSIVVPSGNPNMIRIGDKLAYEKESDLILVNPSKGISK